MVRPKRNAANKNKNKNTNSKGDHFHNGHRMRVSPNPPSFISRPWFPLTVRVDPPGSAVTYSDLRAAILTQLGFGSGTNSLNVRLLSLRGWGPLPVSDSISSIIVFDVIKTTGSVNGGILEQLSDYGDGVNRQAIAYEFSTVQQQHSIVLTTSTVSNITIQSNLSVMYFNLLWRVYDTTPTSLTELEI